MYSQWRFYGFVGGETNNIDVERHLAAALARD
jgi:hypothetical protein